MANTAAITPSSVSDSCKSSHSGKRKKRPRKPPSPQSEQRFEAVGTVEENGERKKRPRKPPSPQSEQRFEAGGTVEENGESPKRQRPCLPAASWKNLDLVLSLQNKQLPFSSKIELASDFVSRECANEFKACSEPLQTPRTASFVGDWIQHLVISFEHGKTKNGNKNITTATTNNSDVQDQSEQQQLSNPSLDPRSWIVLNFCLLRSHFRVSPNILRPITSVLRHGVAFLEDNNGFSSRKGDDNETNELPPECILFRGLSDCLHSLFSSHGKSINNAGVDLWVTSALAAVFLLNKIFSSCDTNSVQFPSNTDMLSCPCCLILEQFSGFLRFHPNPKNVFRSFVDNLFEPLLELLAILRSQTDKSVSETEGRLLVTVQNILSNGLFHPSHMMGFLSIKSTDFKSEEGDKKGFNESYHRLLFQKINKIIAGKKGLAITRLGVLLHLLAARTKKVKVDVMISKQSDGGDSDQVQESSPKLFELFVHFTRPFLLKCNNFIKMDIKYVKRDLKSTMSEANLTIQSLNVILFHFMHEKIYTPLKDTAEGTHYGFLKEIYDTVILLAKKVIQLLSQSKRRHLSTEVLSTIATELVVSIGYFSEIEYRIIGEDLVTVWLLVLSSLAIYMAYVEPQSHPMAISKILDIGCKVIKLYSELRQVESPIFALCKAVRLLTKRDYGEVDFPLFLSDRSLSSGNCAKAVAALLLSQNLKFAMSSAMKLIPEGKAGSFLENLKLDFLESLEWLRTCASKADENLSNENNSTYSDRVSWALKVELLGLLSEPYTIMLNCLIVTSSNSNIVANSLVSLLTAMQPTLTHLPGGPSNNTIFPSHVLCTSHENVEFQTDSVIEHVDPSWLFVFVLRLYISCRSLCHQVLSFMPHNSKKAAELMSVLAVGHDKNATGEPDWRSQSYFSLIGMTSHYLPVVIQSISELCSSHNTAPHGPLLYVLHTMALQRLGDLNRQIKTFEFLQEKESSYAQVSLAHSAALSPDDKMKWTSHIEASREEAASLSNYLTEHITSIASRVKSVVEWTQMPLNIKSWGFIVCSLDENSLPTAIWWLLCKNIDVWCTHSSTKMLKKFIDLIICFALPLIVNNFIRKEVLEMNFQDNVTVYQISSELLMDTLFYEQKVIPKDIFSRFLRVIKKSITPLFTHAVVDGNSSLPCDWTKALTMLDESLMLDKYFDHTSLSGTQMLTSDGEPINVGLKTCQNLLDLLCRVIKIHVNVSSIKSLISYIFDIERLTVLTLLSYFGVPHSFNNIELLQLFVSCRRTLRYLAMASSHKVVTSEQSPLVQFLSENPLSIAWLVKSVCEVASMPCSIFKQEDHLNLREYFSVLMDHSSYIFMVSSKGCILELGDVEMIAEVLKVQTENFLKTDKCEVLRLVLEGDSRQECLNRHSHLISCIQGFLSGVLSVLSRKDKKYSKKDAQIYTLSCFSNLYSYIKCFEHVINLCLTRLFSHVHNSKNMHQTTFETDLKHGITSADQCLLSDVLDKSNVGSFDISPHKPAYCSLHYLEKDDEGSLLTQCTGSSDIQPRVSMNHGNGTDILQGIYSSDLLMQLNHREDLLERLLKNELPEVSFLVRQLFISSATILNLQFMFSPMSSQLEINCVNHACDAVGVLLGTAFQALQMLVDIKGMLHSCTYAWIEGIFKYLEVVGQYISHTDPVRSRNVYTSLIDIHLIALGKCISLQGKSAALASHEMGSSTKLLQPGNESHDYDLVCHDHDANSLNEFKSRVRASFKTFIKTPLELHLLSAVQAVERSLIGIGVRENLNAIYDIHTGDLDGGRVSPTVAAGVDCLDLFLESVSGKRSLGIARRHIQSLVSALFNIVLHLQSPIIFYHCNWLVDPDPGSVILMCVEVLGKIAGKNSLSQMDSWVVSQCLQLPVALFNDFLKHNYSKVVNHVEKKHSISVNQQFCVDLYAACCRLLCSTLRHRMSDMGRCIPLLQNSVNVLLACLEKVDTDIVGHKDYFAWETQEAIMCASFLRRIYEEIRQQKVLVARYASHFLSSYISVYSGFGPLRSGIKREIDEVLRPGIYALIDICTPDDLQQLHTVLADGACRRTLSTLQHDYKLNFQYEGKI